MLPKSLNLSQLLEREQDRLINLAILQIDLPGAVVRNRGGFHDVTWIESDGSPNGQTWGVDRFQYVTSCDAVMPLLKNWDWRSIAIAGGPVQVTLEAGSVTYVANARSFARAACIALLQANGVQVIGVSY